MTNSSRRQFLAACAALPVVSRPGGAAPPDNPPAFKLCLNTATLRGYRIGIVETIDAAGKAGYHAIEPWLDSLTAYTGSLPDLRKRIADFGMTVESAIAFPQWVVDDPARRAQAMEQAKREMDLVTQIGGRRIAAPPAGANTAPEIPLSAIAERYRALLELGDRMGIVPELEFWGSSTNLSKLSQAIEVAVAVNHPKACVLADVFHLYKGGSGFAGLHLLGAPALPVLHMNDYPTQPPRETIADRDRVYPGDGVAPLKQILADLRKVNPALVLSLEVFNPAYWKTDALDTARTGLSKLKAATA
jgi:2-keto-myo-inositol isomerase